MITWDSFNFVLALVAALSITGWLIRIAGPRTKPTFECNICGRRHLEPMAHQWRYCPYCGAPRDTHRMGTLPSKKSVLDV
ncbi:MAG: hypothetical protein R3C68_12790 [Myxococcota bacterium]